MRFINPYNNVVFGTTPQVMSNTHEHIYDTWYFKRAYEQGIRIFACVNYFPSAPSVSTKHLNDEDEMSNYSNWKIPVTDWISTDIPEGAPLLPENEKSQYFTTRYYENKIPSVSVTVNGVTKTINTKLIPQISNAEHAFHRWSSDAAGVEPTHHNVLGSLVTEPTNGFSYNKMTDELYPGFDANHEFSTLAQERTWRHQHMPYTFDEIAAKYIDPNYQQFNGKIFGTVNHSFVEEVEEYFIRYPQVFKALELFNQFMSPTYNANMRSRYDALLRKGYRIFGVAVVDWLGTVEAWGGLTDNEKNEWYARFNALTTEEKAQYGSANNYYNETVVRQAKFNRGANMLYIDDYDEESIDTLEKAMATAEKGLDAYIAGRYFMTGTGVNSIEILEHSVANETVHFKVTGNPSTIRAITSARTIEGTGNEMTVLIERGETYIRFEAYYQNNHPEGWDDMTIAEQEAYIPQGVEDFLFTNPIWIEDNDAPIHDTNISSKAMALGII